MDALGTANVNFVHTQPIIFPLRFPLFIESVSPNFCKNTFASLPIILSTDQQKRVKEALLSSQADEYFGDNSLYMIGHQYPLH